MNRQRRGRDEPAIEIRVCDDASAVEQADPALRRIRDGADSAHARAPLRVLPDLAGFSCGLSSTAERVREPAWDDVLALLLCGNGNNLPCGLHPRSRTPNGRVS